MMALTDCNSLQWRTTTHWARCKTGTMVFSDYHSLFWKSTTTVKGRISRIALSTSASWDFNRKGSILQGCQWTAFQSTKAMSSTNKNTYVKWHFKISLCYGQISHYLFKGKLWEYGVTNSSLHYISNSFVISEKQYFTVLFQIIKGKEGRYYNYPRPGMSWLHQAY